MPRKKTNGNGTPAVGHEASAKENEHTGAVRSAILRGAESALVGRQQWANETGFSFWSQAEGRFLRSMNDALGYAKTISVKDYRARYERGGIAKRVVDIYPKATWVSGADVQEIDDVEKTTKFEGLVEELFARLQVWKILARVDTLAGIGRYGVLFIGADGDWITPLGKLKIDNVLYLTPYAEDRATIEKVVTDAKDPRFGQPEFYSLQAGVATSNAGASQSQSTRRVHWSRVIHVAEGCLEDEVYGTPRMQSVWNYLDDLAKIVGGGAEAAWRRMDPGLHIDVDPAAWAAAKMDAAAEARLQEQIEEYTHNLRRTLQTVGTKVNPLSAAVTAFGVNADTILSLISATTGIPQRLLKGSEMGELASSQDRNNWADRVLERRRSFAEPLVRDFLKRLIEAGALPEPKEINVVWPESEELNEAEKASMTSTLANANQAQVGAGDNPIMLADEMRDRIWGLEPIEMPEPEEEEVPPALELADIEAQKKLDEMNGVPPKDGVPAKDGAPPVPPKKRAATSAKKRSSREKVLAVADRFAPPIARAFESAFVSARAAVDMAALTAAVEAGDRATIEHELSRAMVDFADHLDDALPARLMGAVAPKAKS